MPRRTTKTIQVHLNGYAVGTLQAGPLSQPPIDAYLMPLVRDRLNDSVPLVCYVLDCPNMLPPPCEDEPHHVLVLRMPDGMPLLSFEGVLHWMLVQDFHGTRGMKITLVYEPCRNPPCVPC